MTAAPTAPFVLRNPSQSVGAAKRDPAPSRFAYRLQRWWLTPLVRAVLRVGMPAFALSFAAGFYLSNPATIESISMTFLEIRRSVEERPEFMVHKMAILGASQELSEDIREIVPLDFPISSFDLDLPGMVQLVGDLDAVAQVDMMIRPGGVLEVSLSERQAAILWQSRDALEALDQTGHRVGPVDSREARADLPFVLGDGADSAIPEAMALMGAAQRVLPNVLGLVRMGARRWDLVLTDGPRIQLPEQGALNALRWVLAQHAAQELLARDLTHVDMRVAGRPVLRMTDTARLALDELRGVTQVRSN